MDLWNVFQRFNSCNGLVECISKLHMKFFSKEWKIHMQFKIPNEAMSSWIILWNLDNIIIKNLFQYFHLHFEPIIEVREKNYWGKIF